MAIIYNSELTRQLTEGAKIQISRDLVPSQLAEKVVPVMEVNPNAIKYADTSFSISWVATGGSTTITTLPLGKTFFVTGVAYTATANATCDQSSKTFNLNVSIDGSNNVFPLFSMLTLTALNVNGSINFTRPIRTTPGTSLTTDSRSYTVGAFIGRITVYGYFLEGSNA